MLHEVTRYSCQDDVVRLVCFGLAGFVTLYKVKLSFQSKANDVSKELNKLS